MPKELPMCNLARCLALTILALVQAVPFTLGDKAPELLPNRPKVPGRLRLQLRERRETQPGSGQYQVGHRSVDWEVAQTAILICDMWDDHYCKSAAQRVGVLVPRMNQVLTAARSHGVLIIHA